MGKGLTRCSWCILHSGMGQELIEYQKSKAIKKEQIIIIQHLFEWTSGKTGSATSNCGRQVMTVTGRSHTLEI